MPMVLMNIGGEGCGEEEEEEEEERDGGSEIGAEEICSFVMS